MKKLLIPLCLLTLVLAGCANNRPSDDNAYQAAVSTATQNETVKFNQTGIWYPNQSKILIRPIFAMPPMLDVNFAVTDKAIYAMEWDGNAKEYNVIYKQDIQDIQQVKYETFGLTKRLFIQSKTSWDGVTTKDIDKAYEYLKTVIPDTARK